MRRKAMETKKKATAPFLVVWGFFLRNIISFRECLPFHYAYAHFTVILTATTSNQCKFCGFRLS